jgi:CRISPR-associated endonuclease Csn1
MIKRLSDAAHMAPSSGWKRFAALEGPWPNFADCVRSEINHIIVSHRVAKKVWGALHEETIYSAPAADGDVRVRKPLASLTLTELESIADESVKSLVISRLNGGDPKKVFASEENFPYFETSDGRRIPIKRVRVRKAVPTFTLGEGRTARHVAPESNHHVEIFSEVDENGKPSKWEGEVVPMHQAFQRLRTSKPLVQRDHGPLAEFEFSLGPGEVLEAEGKDRVPRL